MERVRPDESETEIDFSAQGFEIELCSTDDPAASGDQREWLAQSRTRLVQCETVRFIGRHFRSARSVESVVGHVAAKATGLSETTCSRTSDFHVVIRVIDSKYQIAEHSGSGGNEVISVRRFSDRKKIQSF